MAQTMLKLDYVALGTAAKELRTEGDNFEKCITKMGKTIKGLPDIWEAETCDEYVIQYEKSEKTLDDVRDLIEDMAKQMESISKNFKDADESMRKQMK